MDKFFVIAIVGFMMLVMGTLFSPVFSGDKSTSKRGWSIVAGVGMACVMGYAAYQAIEGIITPLAESSIGWVWLGKATVVVLAFSAGILVYRFTGVVKREPK